MFSKVASGAIIASGMIGGCIGVSAVVSNFQLTPDLYTETDCPSMGSDCYYCDKQHDRVTYKLRPPMRAIMDVTRLSGCVFMGATCGTICGLIALPMLTITAPVIIPYFAYTYSTKPKQ
jgi:hypothetical protein